MDEFYAMLFDGGTLKAPKPSIETVIKPQEETPLIDHRREIKGECGKKVKIAAPFSCCFDF